MRLNEVKKHPGYSLQDSPPGYSLQDSPPGYREGIGGWEEITSCHASIRMCEEYVVSFPFS